MPIKLVCPRCKKPLAVPGKMAGSYVNCPECGGRFWAPVSSPEATSNSGEMPVATPPAAAPSKGQARNVARFVSADAAQSPLKLAEDGKLPELRLARDDEKAAVGEKSNSISPVVLVCLLAISVALSLLLVLWDPSASGVTDEKVQARQTIRDNFFLTTGEEALAPYQQWLRQAQRAASRGDHQTEQKLYQKVLDQLRAQRGPFDPGVTGSRARDEELENLIIIILRK